MVTGTVDSHAGADRACGRAAAPAPENHAPDVHPDELLLPVTADFFTRAQALAAGESDRSLRAALRAGAVVRLRHGSYARSELVRDLDERARHLLLARAALHQQRGEVALAGPSAALLHGFDVFGHDLGLVHVTRLDLGAGRREAGVVHHVVGRAAALRTEVRDGVLVVSPEDALWQTARLSSLEGGVITADSALHQRPSLADPLRDLVARTKAQPHSRTARLALRLARAEAESPGESLTRVACFRHGIPAPSLQHDVLDPTGRRIGRTDFYWEEARLLGEFDGKIKYERLLRRGETSSDAVVREKRREDAVRRTRCGMSRFTWSEVQPDVAHRRMAQLARELEDSRQLYVRVAA